MNTDIYLDVPVWAISIGLLVMLLVAREVGHWLRGRIGSAQATDNDFAMTSVLGLLALFIGFTFSIALGKFEQRRQLVIAESNAIGTTWLRTSQLDAPERDRVRAVLRNYVDARVAYGNAHDRTTESDARRKTEALQAQLWDTVMQAVASFRDSPRASLLITTTNDAIDLAAERFAERDSHVPSRILRLLGLFAAVSAALVGFHRGGQRHATTVLFVLLTLAIALVLDLDRPTTGLTQVTQQPMLDLQQSIRGPGSQAPVVRNR